jgi:hypothetical protein
MFTVKPFIIIIKQGQTRGQARRTVLFFGHLAIEKILKGIFVKKKPGGRPRINEGGSFREKP